MFRYLIRKFMDIRFAVIFRLAEVILWPAGLRKKVIY